MGLDQYAYKVKDEEQTEVSYWRKFNALEGWMEDLYRSRDGEGDFNCERLELSSADLDDLEDAIRNEELQPREGFFFGPQEIHPEEIMKTRRFITDARNALSEGCQVFYTSWW